jgi:signal transduction histidine kinase
MNVKQVPVSIVPENDEDRLKRLYRYEILDTVPEEAFDKIARLAAQIFDAPGAFISFVDKDKVFYKAKLSDSSKSDVPRGDSLCSYTVYEGETIVYSDTHLVPQLAGNPLVHTKGGIRFYAGSPIKTSDNFSIGSICVVEDQPKLVSDKQLQMLETLASIVMDELEARMIARKAVRVQTDLMNITVHDLKNPLSVIRLYGQLIKQRSGEDKIKEMANKIWLSAEDMLTSLNDLLNLSQIENGALKITLEKADLNVLLEKVKKDYQVLTQQKQQTVTIHNDNARHLQVDSGRISEVFENLLSNAIKYSYPGGDIEVFVTNDAEHVLVEFRDKGQGLNKADMQKLFTKFAKLSSIPTGKERSHGLGLSIVKTLVELHGGKVWATSEGKDCGSSFFVSLPVE